MAPRSFHIAVSITSHGFGHLTRTLAVVRELLERTVHVRVTVSATIPPRRIFQELGREVGFRARGFEPGTAQRSCFEVDVEGTRALYRRFLSEREERMREEEAFLRGVDALLSDIPALPIAAAANVKIPAVGLSNFTWDWILDPLLEGSDIADVPRRLRDDYASGDLYLRLPLGSEESPFPRTEAAPLVGRRSSRDPLEVRRVLGVEAIGDRRIVLVCPGGWGAGDWASISLRDTGKFAFLFVGDLPIQTDAPSVHLPHELPSGVSFPDLVRAADIVLTKSGYGIASECVLNRTRFVSVERRGFREEERLVPALGHLLPVSRLSLPEFFAGRWDRALLEVLSRPLPSSEDGARSPEATSVNGAEQVARRIAGHFEIDWRSP